MSRFGGERWPTEEGVGGEEQWGGRSCDAVDQPRPGAAAAGAADVGHVDVHGLLGDQQPVHLELPGGLDADFDRELCVDGDGGERDRAGDHLRDGDSERAGRGGVPHRVPCVQPVRVGHARVVRGDRAADHAGGCVAVDAVVDGGPVHLCDAVCAGAGVPEHEEHDACEHAHGDEGVCRVCDLLRADVRDDLRAAGEVCAAADDAERDDGGDAVRDDGVLPEGCARGGPAAVGAGAGEERVGQGLGDHGGDQDDDRHDCRGADEPAGLQPVCAQPARPARRAGGVDSVLRVGGAADGVPNDVGVGEAVPGHGRRDLEPAAAGCAVAGRRLQRQEPGGRVLQRARAAGRAAGGQHGGQRVLRGHGLLGAVPQVPDAAARRVPGAVHLDSDPAVAAAVDGGRVHQRDVCVRGAAGRDDGHHGVRLLGGAPAQAQADGHVRAQQPVDLLVPRGLQLALVCGVGHRLRAADARLCQRVQHQHRDPRRRQAPVPAGVHLRFCGVVPAALRVQPAVAARGARRARHGESVWHVHRAGGAPARRPLGGGRRGRRGGRQRHAGVQPAREERQDRRRRGQRGVSVESCLYPKFFF
ncbi:hypothetical protein KL929_004819 [Ogataea haglerorum]|nr:hypothetical protein KL929_004819 [Ogataea haglerorum]